jgi:hypothetical protein
MGGAESLYIGLNNLESLPGSVRPARVVRPPIVTPLIPGWVRRNWIRWRNKEFRLLWIACGTEVRLIEPNREFREWLTSKGVEPVDIETPWMHTWMVWRRNMTAFAPLLFQRK